MASIPPDYLPGIPAGGGSYDAAAALGNVRAILSGQALLIPLHEGRKNPSIKGWADLTGPRDLVDREAELFRGSAGIGLVCGPPSSGMCFLDADSDGAIPMFENAFPGLKDAHRITGGRGCKWIVRVMGQVRGFALRCPGGTRCGEFLGFRQQGVVAGIHPVTGSPYSWRVGSGIPEIDIALLRREYSLYNKPLSHPL